MFHFLFKTFISKCRKIEWCIRKGCIFSADIDNLYSKVIIRELDVLLGYIIGMNEIAGNHKQHIKGKGEEKTINCKKIECTVISKRYSPRYQNKASAEI